MADINRGEVCQGFIFGQNMEDRVVQSAEVGDGDDESDAPTEDVAARLEGDTAGCEGVSSTSTPLLRPSSFSANNSNSATTPGGMPAGTLSSNPFAATAARGNSHSVSSSSEMLAADSNAAQCNRFVLRPSTLDKQTANFGRSLTQEACSSHKTSFKLEPARLQSPLVTSRLTGESRHGGDSNSGSRDGSSPDNGVADSTALAPAPPRPSSVAPPGGDPKRLFAGAPTDTTAADGAPAKLPTSSRSAETIRDAAVGGDEKRNPSLPPRGSEFVFGESMHQRVTNAVVSSFNGAGFATSPLGGAALHGDGVDDNAKASPDGDAVGVPTTLHESAAAEQAKRHKVELEEVDVKTGEEDECNVFQLNAKLHVFQKETWIEKGRGWLRLNDMSDNETAAFQSRLVMRTQGSLRVVLNTKIWAGMSVERVSQKSVRLTAVEDSAGVKIYLITASPNDTDQVFKAIDRRVQQLKEQRREETGADTSSVTAAAKHVAPEKRVADDGTDDDAHSAPTKKARVDMDQRKETREESNDSSTLDPETEASGESFTSSPPMKSSSSDA